MSLTTITVLIAVIASTANVSGGSQAVTSSNLKELRHLASALRSRNSDTAVQALHGLAKIANEYGHDLAAKGAPYRLSTEELEPLVKGIARCADQGNPAVRLEAMHTLAALGTPPGIQFFPMCGNGLEDHASYYAHPEFFKRRFRIRGDLQKWVNDRNPTVVLNALYDQSAEDLRKLHPQLIRMSQSPDPRFRFAAVCLFRPETPLETARLLAPMLDDPDPDHQVLRATRRMLQRGPVQVPALFPWRLDFGPIMRRILVIELADDGSEPAIQKLRQMTSDPLFDVRTDARAALKRLLAE